MNEELKTGYPHKDKMWLKYYDREFLKRKNPSDGIYDYMKEKTNNIQDYTALSYFGKNVLYGELYENIICFFFHIIIYSITRIFSF